MNIKKSIEKKNREYFLKLKIENEILEYKEENPAICNNCRSQIIKGDSYLSQTIKDEKNGDVVFWYCKNCIKEILSEKKYNEILEKNSNNNRQYKIVYNNCYGGFCLSLKAIDWLEKNCSDLSLKEFIASKRAECERDFELIFSVTEWFEEKRHHKDLVDVVEALGKEASDKSSALQIEKISSRQYRIKSYDGFESVVTPENEEKWIFIE